MISCAPTTITRARTGKTTSRIRCKSWTADELAKLPTYYIMDLAKDMAETVAEEMPSAAEIAANQWLPDSELAFYSAEYARTGFQGGLQWYRCGTSGAFDAGAAAVRRPHHRRALLLHLRQAGLGHLSAPRRRSSACRPRPARNMIGCHLVDGAGHWVQQEQPEEVSRLLLQFLQEAKERGEAERRRRSAGG